MINVLVLSPCNEIYKNKLASSSDKLSFEYVNPEASPEKMCIRDSTYTASK